MTREISSKADFLRITKASKLTVADFYANWCGPCRAIAPFVDQLSTKYTDVEFIKVNVDEHQNVYKK